MKRPGIVFAVLATAAFMSVCYADTVSWNYNRNGDAYTTQSTDFAGVGEYSAAYWNDSWLDGLATDLLDNTGAATTIDISWQSYNTWSIQGSHPGIDTDGSHNKEILNGYLNSGPAGWNPPLTYSRVTLSQIGYSSYDIVVYFSSDVAGREGYVTDGTTTYYFNTLGPASIASGNALFVQAADTTTNGYTLGANYAVFSSLSGDSQTITCQMRDLEEWGGIAAVQIAEVTTISYNSPVYGAALIPVERTSAQNDLVFTVIDPNITEVDIQLGTENDPNLTTKPAYKIVDGMAVTTDQYTVNLESLASDLQYETTYYWKVIGYTDSNSIAGPVWSFTTVPEDPLITQNPPVYTAVDAGEPNIVLSANGINGDFKWYKDGSPIDDTVGVYTGTTTNTLTIYDVQSADEGYYTLKVSSFVGEDESTPCRVMIHRLTSHYNFDSITTLPDGNDVFIDSIDGYHAMLKQESASAGWPTVNDVNEIVGNGCLQLDNADHAADPNGQYLQIYPGVADYEDITISFWAQSNSVAVWSRLLDFGSGTPDYLFITPDFGSGYDPRFAIRIDNGTEQLLQPNLDSSNWIGPGTGWHFIAVTIGGNTGKMYVDGLWYVTNTGMAIDPLDIGAVLNYIGKSQYGADPEFSGYIDDLKIYNYARTNEQIAQDYMAVTGGSYICDTENNDVWRYDQGWETESGWVGGNNNCMIDLPDFAGLAARWLEADQFYPAP